MPGNEIQGGDSNLSAPDSGERQVWFTGYKNDETTALARSSSNGGLTIGSVVCFTETGGYKGRGKDVTKPETAILPLFAGIVTGLSDTRVGQYATSGDGSGVTAGNLIWGWIKIVSAGAAIQCWTKANMVKPSSWSGTPVLLGPADNSWCLNAITSSVATGIANALALLKVAAIPLQTVDTSSLTEPDSALFSSGATANTNSLKTVRLGGVFGGLET